MKRMIFLCAMVLSMMSCLTPQFFLVETKETPWSRDAPDDIELEESYVIANAPFTKKGIVRAVDEFNRRTLSFDDITKYKMVRREFYRESYKLSRNFKSGELYRGSALLYFWFGEKQDLQHHWDEDLISTLYAFHWVPREGSCMYFWSGKYYDNYYGDPYISREEFRLGLRNWIVEYTEEEMRCIFTGEENEP